MWRFENRFEVFSNSHISLIFLLNIYNKNNPIQSQLTFGDYRTLPPLPIHIHTHIYLSIYTHSIMSPHGFDYFVVIDFEATCDKQQLPYPQEIIEFPSVIVDAATGELVDSFQTYVRPIFNHLLTDFCIDLTGIQQSQVCMCVCIHIFISSSSWKDMFVSIAYIRWISQVDNGVTLFDALVAHHGWLCNNGLVNNFAVVTWTDWDCKVMLEKECRLKNIPKPAYFDRYIRDLWTHKIWSN